MKLSEAQRRILKKLPTDDEARYWHTWGICLVHAEARIAGHLARKGLVKKTRHGESSRGERRQYWMEYRITEAGRAALAEDGE